MLELGKPFKEAGIFGEDGGLVEKTVVDYRALIPVPDDIPIELLPFVETASCPIKAITLALKVRAVYTERFREDPLPKLALVSGATGKSEGVLVKLLQNLGFKVVAVGRRDYSDAKVQKLTSRGVDYEVIRNEPDFAISLRKYGEFSIFFDLTGNIRLVHTLFPAVGNTGAIIAYSIPSKEQLGEHDPSKAWADITLANKVIIGSVNASANDWIAATKLIQQVSTEDPEFLLEGLFPINGLDVDLINEAISNPEVQVPIVFPNPELYKMN